MIIEGSCHCGNITFSMRWKPAPSEIASRACGCSFCIKHGGVWTSSPKARLRVHERDPSLVSRYTMGTGTAEFHVCSRCGVVPLVTSAIDGHDYAVVNVNTFTNVDRALIAMASADFDGETVTTRLERRRRGWIGDVTIETER